MFAASRTSQKPSHSSSVLSNLVISALAVLVSASVAQAQQAAPKASAPAPQKAAAPAANGAAPAAGDKLDVSDLENKYWSAKDSDFSVVQNRLYSKAHRFALTAAYGTLMNDPWTTGQVFDGSLGYYFNEHWGLELNYSNTSTQDNKAVQKLNSQLGTPDYNKLGNFYGVKVDWVPFYAKMSLMNWTIVYFDLQFALGAGMQSYSQQQSNGAIEKSTPALTFDVTESFYLTRYLAIRVDLKNRWYNEETMKYQSHTSNGNDFANATELLGGLTFFFP